MPDPSIPPRHGSLLAPSLDRATVSDAMHPGILSCEVRTPLRQVARMMSLHRVHCVAVMARAQDHSGESLVWGILSDLDLMRAGVTGGETRAGDAGGEETRAGDVAQQPVISVKPTMDLREAAGLMLRHGVTHLVVIDENALMPVGIISTLDVVDVLAWGED